MQSKRIGILPEFVPWGAPKGEVHRGGTAASPGHSPVERNYTKRIEDATARKVQIDGKSLESAENRLKNVLADFERQGYRMKNGGYVDKRISFYSILCAVISLLFACFMCYLWTDAAKDRDNYKQYYEYYQEQAREQKGNK